MKTYFNLFIKTVKQWLKNEPFQQSAIIAYYTLFSLPSLMVIVVSIAGYFFGKSNVQDQIIDQLSTVMGSDTAKTIENLISNAEVQEESITAIIISLGVLIFGATGAFFQLKKAMNRIWRVREIKSNILMMVLNRLVSLGMILVIGFMLVASLIITTLVTALGDYIKDYAPQLTSTALNVFNFVFSYLFITTLFAAIFKVLPDVKIRWKAAFTGASITAVLFLIAEFGLGLYFGTSNPTSVFGGASSVVLIMLWIYYSCLILFFGAEFTLQYSLLKHEHIEPNRYSEPAIIQDLKDIKEEQLFMEEGKIILKQIGEDVKQDLEEEDQKS